MTVRAASSMLSWPLPSHLGVFADRHRTKPFTAILEKSGLARCEKFEPTRPWYRAQCTEDLPSLNAGS